MENSIINNPEKRKVVGSEKDSPVTGGFVFESEDERLAKDVRRTDIEKLQLFTKMIRRNAMLKQMTK